MGDFVKDDGGRALAGFKGEAGDCVCRSIAIVTGLPYKQLYAALAEAQGSQRLTKHHKKAQRSARNGITTSRKWFKDFMKERGFKWVPTLKVGEGCKVHLDAKELPAGKLVVAVSRHYTAVIDGVIHDTSDPRREPATFMTSYGVAQMTGGRCVYGYWVYEKGV